MNTKVARIRTIKPQMFTDEDIGDLSFQARWFFAGLFTQADREGRLEDRPRKLKVEVMPYDDVSIEDLLCELTEARFITRYQVEGKRYILIRTFWKHQYCNIKEPPSQLPEPPGLKQSMVPARADTVPAPYDHVWKGREGSREGKERGVRAREPGSLPMKVEALSPLSDSFLEELQAKPIYQGIEVRQVYAKMQVWCQVKSKAPTAERLINWLNREEPPGKDRGSGVSKDGNGSNDKNKIDRVVKRIIANRELDKAKSGST